MERNFLPGTEIEIVNPKITLGEVRHALFDFDGTISLLREGWQHIMGPVCVEMIAGNTEPIDDIREAVAKMIDETTGIQTIYQMERLVEMVRAWGRVPEADIRTAEQYKQIYLDRLMVPVRERIALIERGEKTVDDFRVAGVTRFLDLLKGRDVTMYVFSGTDRDDVRNEADVVQVAEYFEEIWGALPSKAEYSKEKVIREIMAAHQLRGPQVLAVGDGPVELHNIKDAGGIALGVASDEKRGHGWDMYKRQRLIRAGADILVPDFREAEALIRLLFNEQFS